MRIFGQFGGTQVAGMKNVKPSPVTAKAWFNKISNFWNTWLTLIDQVGQMKGMGMLEVAIFTLPAFPLPILKCPDTNHNKARISLDSWCN